MTAPVLVVDDDVVICEIVTGLLRGAGYECATAASGGAALDAVRALRPALVVLDLGLPDVDGLELCRRLREECDVPVVVLSGRDDEVDKVLGLRLGADDYVTKPFGPRELVARVEAVLRRAGGPAKAPAALVVGDLVVRRDARDVEVAGTSVHLTRLEFEILATLCERPDLVVTRRALIERVWDDGWVGDDHVVDVHVANLRRKIDPAGGPSRIRTVRGVGYRMAR